MDVFVVQCLVESLPMQISAFVSYGDRLVLSTPSGALLAYVVVESPAFDIRLVDSRKAASRRPVAQLAALPGAATLLLLEDAAVLAFDLATLALREPLLATKGASLIAACPSERRFAVVVKKKILVYSCSADGTLRVLQELHTLDRAHVLVWLDSNTLAYGHPKRGYYSVKVDTNEIVELYKFNTSFFSVGSAMGGKLGIAQLPKGQLMLTRNDAGVFVNSDASPLIERDLQWSGPPDYITFSAPYVVAFIAGCIEVRSLTTGGIVQRVEFQDSQTVALGGDSLIHVSSLNCIWRLLPVSFEDQIEHLIASNQFIEAQRLIEELEFSSEEEKISNIIRVRGLYAHFMFTSERKYEEAISILSELRASPIDIVNLFPQFSLLGPSSELPVTDKVALAALKDYLILQRQILSKLRKLHQRPNHLPSNQIPPTFVSATNTEATTHTTIAASSLFSGSDHGVPDPVPFPATVLANAEDAVFLSSVVDTTLLKVYLTVNEALVGSLVRVENYCDIEESEGALKSKNKHRELIEFYYGKGLHRRALENLVDHPDGIVSYLKKLDINANVDLFIEFIGPVFDRDAIEGMNIFTDRYEEIPLKTQLKIQHYLEVRSSSLEARYLEYLIEDGGSEQPEFHDRIILLYLQELVDSLAEMQEPPPKTQGLLFSENTGGGGGGGGFVEDGNSSDLGTRKTIAFLLMRRKLVSFLEKSKFYRPDRVVGLFPEDVLLEERTVILGRLNRHTESLKICIEKLENYSLAQRYCEIHYSATDPLCSDIFITLLTLMLEVQKSSFATGNEKIKMDQIIDFVVQYGTYLDGTRILPLLPPTLPLSSLVGYFEKSLQSLHFTDHNAKVGLNVATLEHIQVQEKLIEYQSRSITIMEDRQCARCSKKIAGSVFAAYAKDLVVHVYCMT